MHELFPIKKSLHFQSICSRLILFCINTWKKPEMPFKRSNDFLLGQYMCTWISLINPYHRLEVLLLLTLLCISFKTMCARYAKVGFKVLGSVHYLSTEGSGQDSVVVEKPLKKNKKCHLSLLIEIINICGSYTSTI